MKPSGSTGGKSKAPKRAQVSPGNRGSTAYARKTTGDSKRNKTGFTGGKQSTKKTGKTRTAGATISGAFGALDGATQY